jgi:hypothetical protein
LRRRPSWRSPTARSTTSSKRRSRKCGQRPAASAAECPQGPMGSTSNYRAMCRPVVRPNIIRVPGFRRSAERERADADRGSSELDGWRPGGRGQQGQAKPPSSKVAVFYQSWKTPAGLGPSFWPRSSCTRFPCSSDKFQRGTHPIGRIYGQNESNSKSCALPSWLRVYLPPVQGTGSDSLSAGTGSRTR